jgi:cytochrome c-type biogenesis protein CcmE
LQYTPADQPAAPSEPTGIASVLTGRRKAIILGTILFAAFGYFAFTAFQNATSYYFSVDEFVERGPIVGENVRVKGTLVPFSFERESARSTIAHFTFEDGDQQMAATYDGVLPDLFFNPHSELVLGGSYQDSGEFLVEQVQVKCPSKYQSLDVENPYDDIPQA